MSTPSVSTPPSLFEGKNMEDLATFQQGLEEALSTVVDEQPAFVAVHCGETRWLIDVDHLSETSIVPSVARTGRASPGVWGIANFKGRIVSLLDMNYVLLGKPMLHPESAWATLLHKRWGHDIALLWPQVIGLYPRTLLHPYPIYTETPPACARARWQDGEGQDWWELGIDAVLSTLHLNQPDLPKEEGVR